jgi:hypothetical protein
VTRDQMQQFVRFGAEARLQAISEEREAILSAFPNLGRSFTQSNASLDGAVLTVRKRRTMSAAERRAVGKRMKAYWAKRKAAKGKTAKKSAAKPKRKGGMSAEARKRQAERMKAYWAARRVQKPAGAESAAPKRTAAGTSSPAKPRRRAGRKAGARSL